MSLDALRAALAARGGTIADVLAPPGDRAPTASAGDPVPPGLGAPQLAAAGPRTAANPAEYELLLEMILEGSLLHYGAPRVVATDDRDLALLLGDQLYALGLSHLADLGDLESVHELADLISLLAQAQLAGNSALAGAVWQAGAAAIGWGQTPEHQAAKDLARGGDASAPAALIQSASRALGHPSETRGGGCSEIRDQ